MGSNSSEEDDDASENVTIHKEGAWTIALKISYQAFNLIDKLAEIFWNSEQLLKAVLQNLALPLHASHLMCYPMCLNCVCF